VADEALFAHYRAGIKRLLKLPAELSPGMQDRIRHAVRLRHYDVKAREQINSTPAADVGSRFLDQLKEADDELKPDQVHELEALIDATLAPWPPPHG
jgi:hypothetical protein